MLALKEDKSNQKKHIQLQVYTNPFKTPFGKSELIIKFKVSEKEMAGKR